MAARQAGQVRQAKSGKSGKAGKADKVGENTMVSGALGHQVDHVIAVSRALGRQVGSATAVSRALGRQVGSVFAGRAGRKGRKGIEMPTSECMSRMSTACQLGQTSMRETASRWSFTKVASSYVHHSLERE